MTDKPTYEELENRIQELERAATEQRQGKKTQQDIDEWYHLLADKITDNIWVLDPETLKITYISPSVFRISGYTAEEVIGLHMQNLMTPASFQLTTAILKDELSIAEQNPDEFRFRTLEIAQYHKNGKLFWTEASMRFLFNDQGKPISVLGVTREISERKQVEQELQEIKNRFRLFIDSTPDLCFLKDKEGKYLMVNHANAQFFGLDENEIIGKTDFDLMPREAARMCNASDIRAMEDKKVVLEVESVGDRVFETRKIPVITHDDVLGVAGIIRDITERTQAESALQKSEERFKLLFEFAPDAYYLNDMQGTFLDGNRNAEELLGYEKKELIGKNFFEANILPISELSKAAEILSKNREGKTSGPDELQLIRKDGQSVTTEILAHPIQIDGKDVVLGIARDISDRKRMQSELQQAHKMEAIGTLTGGVAHDFNNILGIIIGNTELALDEIPQWNPTHFNLVEIKAAAIRASGIVKQLLSFSRKTGHAMKPIGGITVIKDSLRFLRSSIPTTIDIRINIPETDVTILADPVQINQIMMNLCINASQEMEAHGGVLEIAVQKITLDLEETKKYAGLQEGDFLKLTVRDTGSGIDSTIIDKIFDPYFTTKEVGRGSGMGLAVVHGIVKNHKGYIAVDSIPGEGTVFTILFPTVVEKPCLESDTDDTFPTGTESILFVDDEIAMIRMAGQILERLGYHVETTLCPEDALELFQSKPHAFDLVITDMTMPKMTGTMLSEKLIKIRPDIPIIICTGYSSMVDAEKAKEIGIAAYIMKPIVKREIAGIIRKVLDT